MLKFIGRMLRLSGEYKGRIKLSFVLSFLESALSNMPVFAALYVFLQLFAGTLSTFHVWVCGGMLLGSMILRCILRRIFVKLESGSGYEICARERLTVGDRLRRFPMGYFTEGNLGNVTSVAAGDLLFVEEHGMGALDKVVNGYCGIAIGCLFLLLIDWRVAMISIATVVIALLLLERVEKVAAEQSAIRQRQSARLTDTVLEYVKGISVIKSLHMAGDKAGRIKDTIEETRDHAINYEKQCIPPVSKYQHCFSLGIGLVVFAAVWFATHGTMEFPIMLTLLIYVFYLYKPMQALSTLSAQIRVMEAGLDRYEALGNVAIIDETGRDIPLDRFDIEFRDVSFSYQDSETLRNVSFTVPQQSMTALVGASGSGKSTIANLIVRFWDVQKGSVRVGGVDVKEMTCESLLQNISMVFQKVYLFQDTIAGNIRFGRPGATDNEIVEAAKKACCHDFITALPDGYDTLVGSGGSTLSGGEKQRISIARAILKDAPIILLDEATASVDPDNERHIQQAISELVRDKTLVVIAHRLSTIRSANQILVVDSGQIVQRGTHDQLLCQGGQYANLWQRRQSARSWKITA